MRTTLHSFVTPVAALAFTVAMMLSLHAGVDVTTLANGTWFH